jgi:hypothetical protein
MANFQKIRGFVNWITVFIAGLAYFFGVEIRCEAEPSKGFGLYLELPDLSLIFGDKPT